MIFCWFYWEDISCTITRLLFRVGTSKLDLIDKSGSKKKMTSPNKNLKNQINPTPVPIDLFFVKSKSKNRNSTKESSISSIPSSLPSTVKSNSSYKPPHHIGGQIGGHLDQSDSKKKRRKMNSKNRIKPFSTLQMIYKKPWLWRFMTIIFCSVQPNTYLKKFDSNNFICTVP